MRIGGKDNAKLIPFASCAGIEINPDGKCNHNRKQYNRAEFVLQMIEPCELGLLI